MSRLRFPTLPSAEKDKADKSLTKPGLKPHVNLTNSSSFSHANTTAADDKTDDLLSWIDSLKIRARDTFARQSKELGGLRKNARREELRRKYREQIDLTSFDKLGELLKQQEMLKNAQNQSIEAQLPAGSLFGQENEPLASGAYEYRDSPYPEDESDENIEESENEFPEKEPFEAANRQSEIYTPNNAFSSNYDQDDDDIVEILSDESAAEAPEPARPQYAEYSEEEDDEESEQELEEEYGEEVEGEIEDYDEDLEEYDEEDGAEEDDENEGIIIDGAEDEELQENLDQNRAFSGHFLLQIHNQNSHSHGQKVAYHVQNGRPRLSDFHPQSYTQNASNNYEEEDEEDEEDEESAMESGDFNEMSDNLDAVEDQYPDEDPEDEVEQQLGTRNDSDSEEEEDYEQTEGLDNPANASFEDQEVGLEYGSGINGSMQDSDNVPSSANMFEAENLAYHSELQNLAEIAASAANAEMGISNEDEHDDVIALSSGSELPRPADKESFHNFTEDDSAAESEASESESENDNESSREEHKSPAHSLNHSVESADVETSSPENPEVTAFLDLLSQGAGSDMFADLAQEALSAHAAVEAQMTKELDETLRHETEKLLATGYAQSGTDLEAEDDSGQASGEADEADESGDLFGAQHEPLNIGEDEMLSPEEHSAQDGLETEAKPEFSSDVGTKENKPATNDHVTSLIDPHEAVSIPPEPAVKFRSFKTITEEDPRKILKQLKATQKKFNIKLDAVEQLTNEVGEVLLESDYTDAPSPPQSSSDFAEMAEVIQENDNIEPSLKLNDTRMDGVDGESSEAEDVTDKVLQVFSQKPVVPILSEIDDDEMGSASESEVLAASLGSELPESHAVVVEPQTEEETLVLFDEYTEVENTNFLIPSGIEEPEAEPSAQVFTDLAVEMVTEAENDGFVTPSEVIEPVEPSEAISVAMETFEEALEYAVPTSVVELESMRNTPVSYNFKDVEEVQQDEESEEGLSGDVSMEQSESENIDQVSESEIPQTTLVQEGEMDIVDVPVLEPVSSLEKDVDDLSGKTIETESLDSHDEHVEASGLQAQDTALPDANDSADTNLEDLEDYQSVNISSTSVGSEPETGDMVEDEESSSGDLENHAKSESEAENVDMVSDLSTTTPGAKRKLNEELRSSSPVKKLRTALSKLNPFSWRFSDRSSLGPEMNAQENDFAENDASTERNVPISVHSETSAESDPAPDPNANRSSDKEIEEEKSSLNNQSESEAVPDSDNASQRLQEDMHGDFDVPDGISVTAGETAVSSSEENESMGEYSQSAESRVPENHQFVPLESPYLENLGFVADAGTETQEEFEAIDSEDPDLQTNQMSERSFSIGDNVSSRGESSHADESLSDEALIDTTPSSASVSSENENTLVLSVPPLPAPASFIRIAEAVREDEEAYEFVYSDHSSASSEVTRNIAETSERIQSLTRPIPEIISYIDDAVTPLMTENSQEEADMQGEEDAIGVESRSDDIGAGALAHGETGGESQNEQNEQGDVSENKAKDLDLAMSDTQDAAEDKAAQDSVNSGDSLVEEQERELEGVSATKSGLDMLNETKDGVAIELGEAVKPDEKFAMDVKEPLVSPDRPVFQLIPPLTENLPVAALEENAQVEPVSVPEEDQGEALVGTPENDVAENVSFTQPDVSSSLLPAPDMDVPWLTRPKSNDLQDLLKLMRKKAEQQIEQKARGIGGQYTVSDIDTADRSADSDPLGVDPPHESVSGGDSAHQKIPSKDDVKHGESDEVDGHPEAKVEEPATDLMTAEEKETFEAESRVDDTAEQKSKETGIMSEGDGALSSADVPMEQNLEISEPASGPEERTAKSEEAEYDLAETKVELFKDEPVKTPESPKTPKKANVSKASVTPRAPKTPKTPVARTKNLLKKSLGLVTPRTRYLRSQTQHLATNVKENSAAAETESDHNASSAGLSNVKLEGSIQQHANEATSEEVANETNQDQKGTENSLLEAKATELSADVEPHEPLEGTEMAQMTSQNAEQDKSIPTGADDQVGDTETEVHLNKTTAAPHAPSSPHQATVVRSEGVQIHGVDHSQKSADSVHSSLQQKEADVETEPVTPSSLKPASSDLSEKNRLIEKKLDTRPPKKRGRPGRKPSKKQAAKENAAPDVVDGSSTTMEDQNTTGAEKTDASVTSSDVKGESISTPKRKRGRPPKNRSAEVKAAPVEKSSPLPDLSPQEKPSETEVIKSSPFKGKLGRKPKTTGAQEEKDLLATPDKHLLVNTEDSEDHPALRTRLKSPIKRSIQELATDIDAEPIKKKRNLRRRKATKKVDDAEAAKEQDMRGRSRKR
ncbi:hypothetical protein HF325_002280 [Metschnikowia pulcherrima]|uniref:Uncharacterized protein n=1 Tax=Metschnikowia pulcherrima TaxID=27326 RepID=A0A8H7GSQ2_9ASCO|nr:hypothetical protein HF325_002280 [Metschnikowia pulcherrima]